MPETSIAEVKVPLPWEHAAKYRHQVKEKAAAQFAALWRAHKDREDLELRWGEEVEYMLVDLSDSTARVALCADEVLRRLGPATGAADPTCGAGWRTEYGNMMVEGVTEPPYAWSLDEVLKIEPSLAWRRRELERVAQEVNPSARVVTLSAFPLLGCDGSTAPTAEPRPDGEVSQSLLCPDEATSPHPRYQTFTANYRKRKACKVAAFVPREGILPEQRLSREEIAELPFRLAQKGSKERDPVPGHIYMDSQAFGACQCCMQATFLARNLSDARYLTDQFLVLAPLFLALTAATPFLRGLVADTDTRWPTMQQTWDDRTQEEVGYATEPPAWASGDQEQGTEAKEHFAPRRIRNSRASANDLFIGEDGVASANDVQVPISKAVEVILQNAGLASDTSLVEHIAHTLVRDPMVVFEDRLDVDDCTETDHWEQLQGTNWGSVRFKPPPGKGDIGWRVEFRTPEVQITDFENAAIVAVIRALAEVILEERWDLVIPISLCEANDEQSGCRNAATEGCFWFRDKVADQVPGNLAKRLRVMVDVQPKRRKLRDILSGEGGLFTRLRLWLDGRCSKGACSAAARAKLEAYLLLFERRAAGELPTPAAFLRSRLRAHAAYRGDGVIPPAFVHELCTLAASVNGSNAREQLRELLGDLL